MTETLAVVLYGVLIGHLRRSGTDPGLSFAYRDEYVESGRVALSTRLPIRPGAYADRFIRPFLEGLLPENPATRRRWSRELGVDPTDSFGLLARMGWDCPGAVQICPPADLPDLQSRGQESVPCDDAEIATRLRDLRQDSASWSLPDEHWSLAGQQEKFALILDGQQWLRALGAAATTHIVKPGIGPLHSQALVEHATMGAAARLGVDVARTEFRYFGDEPAIVAERFDRFRRKGSVIRLHQEDFCQASGRVPERKYEAQGGPGLGDLANIVNRNSTDVAADRQALADFLIINYVAGAPDGHAKNLSLLLRPDRTVLAPLYDLASGFPYEGRDVERTVAISIGGERQYSRVFGKQWDRAAATLAVPSELVRNRVSQLGEDFPDAFSDALIQLGLPEAEAVRQGALPRLKAHCAGTLNRLRRSA